MVSSPSPPPNPNSKPKPPHVVIFPFMAQGHTLPLLDLSKSLSSNRNLQMPHTSKNTSLYTTTQISISKQSPSQYFKVYQTAVRTPLVSMAGLIPFLTVTIQLQKPFEQILQHMLESGSLPIFVISDFFLDWTLATCRKFNVPRLVFHDMGVVSMVILKYRWEHAEHINKQTSDTEALQLEGLKPSLTFTLTKSDLSESVPIRNWKRKKLKEGWGMWSHGIEGSNV